MGKRGPGRPACRPDDPGGDLWGTPPAKPVRCPGCDDRAEPYHGRFCWFCVTTGQMARVLRGPTVTRADRRKLLAGPAVEGHPCP